MRLIVSEFVTLDGVMQAPGFDEHPDGKNAWAPRLHSDGYAPMGSIGLRGIPGQWELFQASLGR